MDSYSLRSKTVCLNLFRIFQCLCCLVSCILIAVESPNFFTEINICLYVTAVPALIIVIIDLLARFILMPFRWQVWLMICTSAFQMFSFGAGLLFADSDNFVLGLMLTLTAVSFLLDIIWILYLLATISDENAVVTLRQTGKRPAIIRKITKVIKREKTPPPPPPPAKPVPVTEPPPEETVIVQRIKREEPQQPPTTTIIIITTTPVQTPYPAPSVTYVSPPVKYIVTGPTAHYVSSPSTTSVPKNRPVPVEQQPIQYSLEPPQPVQYPAPLGPNPEASIQVEEQRATYDLIAPITEPAPRRRPLNRPVAPYKTTTYYEKRPTPLSASTYTTDSYEYDDDYEADFRDISYRQSTRRATEVQCHCVSQTTVCSSRSSPRRFNYLQRPTHPIRSYPSFEVVQCPDEEATICACDDLPGYVPSNEPRSRRKRYWR